MFKLTDTTQTSFDQVRPVFAELFGKMSDEVFAEISQMLTWVHFQSDECIFRESEEGDAMYILIHGRLRVVVEKNGEQLAVAEIGSGECVGEMSLLTGKSRNASIYAIRDCNLVRMSKTAFEKIAQLRPQVGLNLSKIIIQRFTEKKSPRPIKCITNVALIPLHKSIDVFEVEEKLKAALKGRKTFEVVSQAFVNWKLEEDIAQSSSENILENSKLTRYLNGLEEENDFVFYIPDPEVTNWTKRCLRQADEIILIGDALESPALTALEKELFYNKKSSYSSAQQTLVLIHPADSGLPTGSKKWLENRTGVDFHSHLRRSDPVGYGKLARYLSGESIGLVLAGGGIKGMAHLGVVRAMEELNIPIDYVGGTSMGAVAGGGIALGWKYEELFEIARELAAKKPTTDYNLLPFISFLKGNQLEGMLSKYFQDYEMEDCFINFYCVSANLSTSQSIVHRRGKMFDSIRASFSLPGVLPPKISPNGYLVDGGIVNNFPVDVMADMGIKTIIGVDFTGSADSMPEFDSFPSGMQMLGSKIRRNKRYEKVPTLMNTIVKSILVNSNYKTQEAIEMTDIYINPNTQKVGLLDWNATEIAIEAGYIEAMKVLEKEWK